MKIRVISTALLCLVAGSVLAQAPGTPASAAQHRIDRLTLLLDLDAGQQVAVQKVLDEQHEQMKTLRQQARPTDKSSETRPTREEMQARREQMRTQHEQLQKDTQEKLRGILSDTQMKKFAALTDSPAGCGPGMGGRHGARERDQAK